jgi:hypothetical protein
VSSPASGFGQHGQEGKVNAFESIVKLYLEEEGYWVRQSVKAHISKEDKVALSLPSMPTPEIDLVALNVKKNELLLVEAKSLLGSYGVYYEAIADEKDELAERYRLFTNGKFREVVTKALREEYLERGLINEKTKINYALAAGHIHSGNEPSIAKYFSDNGWKLFTPEQVKEKVRQLSTKGWEDDLITMTAKLILKK